MIKLVDLHTQTAARIFHIKPEQVTTEQRQYAKAHNYWNLYSQPTPQTLESLLHETT